MLAPKAEVSMFRWKEAKGADLPGGCRYVPSSERIRLLRRDRAPHRRYLEDVMDANWGWHQSRHLLKQKFAALAEAGSDPETVCARESRSPAGHARASST